MRTDVGHKEMSLHDDPCMASLQLAFSRTKHSQVDV